MAWNKICIVAFVTMKSKSFAFSDPGLGMMACVDGGNDVNECAVRTLENFRAVMETGVEELGLPILDPIRLNQINFKFFNLTTEFHDVDLYGFKNFKLKKSLIDKQKRTWKIQLGLPSVNAVGRYKLFGTIPPNLDLGTSAGDERFAADKVDVSIVLSLGADGEKVKITDVQLSIELDDIDLELECLFPRNGKCCPDRYLKSCNSVLAKTVLRFINRDGKNFVKEFQPEITKQIRPIFEDYFNKAIARAKASYLIEYA